MTSQATSSRPGIRLGRRVIQQLRASLERDTGVQAAAYLQEAGFAGGEELFEAFGDWLKRARGVDQPSELDVEFLGEVLGEFFADQGWGRLTAIPLGPAVMALDSAEWAEALDEQQGEFPSCHLSCGLLADFLGRVSGDQVAVMEVECRSRGEQRCRFLAGSPETLGILYDRMAGGTGYLEALGVLG
ncbi:MAG TPA: V4R domain-containing protein [Gemmatimonadales bacterium]